MSVRINFRAPKDLRTSWHQRAAAMGLTMTDWIIQKCAVPDECPAMPPTSSQTHSDQKPTQTPTTLCETCLRYGWAIPSCTTCNPTYP